METALYFLAWAGVIFLMMRFGPGAHVMGHGHSAHKQGSNSGKKSLPRWIALQSVTDPVCGMSVQVDSAKSAVHEGNVYYFCSQDCREKFEAAPDTYPSAPVSEPMTKEHSHG